MADQSENQDMSDRKIIKVAVKTPRDKKDVEIDGSTTIKEVIMCFCSIIVFYFFYLEQLSCVIAGQG
jgi:hypothetical protein